MNNIKKSLILGSLTAVFLNLSSCTLGEFGDINVNPSATQTPVTSALLTNVLANFYSQNTYYVEKGLYAQYFSQSQYPDGSQYATTQVDFSGYYTGTLYDLQNIININTDAATKGLSAVLDNGSNNNQIAVSRIAQAAIFAVVTDTGGDVPYSEALIKKSNPKYDTQQAIYTGLLKELKEAIAQFDNGKAVTGDILNGGSATKWKKYANSLRMILALRMLHLYQL